MTDIYERIQALSSEGNIPMPVRAKTLEEERDRYIALRYQKLLRLAILEGLGLENRNVEILRAQAETFAVVIGDIERALQSVKQASAENGSEKVAPFIEA